MPYTQKLLITIGLIIVIAVALVSSLFRTQPPGITAAFDTEFLTRPDGIQAVEETYNFSLPLPPMHMDPGLMYKACADGVVDLICGFATDGRIPAYDLYIIEDDKNALPPYHAAPLVRQETLDTIPELTDVLALLDDRIPDERMQQLNYRVDEKGIPAATVARDFLTDEKLLDGPPAPSVTDGTRISVGGKNFTEQEILGHMMVLLIEHHLGIPVTPRLNLGGTMICFEALRAGDIDLYAEYTGTGLVNILGEPPDACPHEAYARVQEAFKERYNLVWLPSFGFNNTYTLTTRRSFAEKHALTNISALAAYIHREYGTE